MTNGKPPDKKLPPYVSYKTFWNQISTFKQEGIPSQLDSSVMRNLSGAAQSQLRGALRFFNLIDDNNVPQDALEHLVNAEGAERQQIWRSLVESSYHFIFGDTAPGFDFGKATPQQLYARFREANLSGDTIRKGENFLLHAAKDAGITISPHIPQVRERKASRNSPRPRNGVKGKVKPDSSQPPNEEKPPAPPPRFEQPRLNSREAILQTFVSKLPKLPDFDPKWSDEERIAWFQAVTQFSEHIMTLSKDVEEDDPEDDEE